VVTIEEIEARKVAAATGDLRILLDRLVARAEPVVARMPAIPRVKAVLSKDGGVCPQCSAPLDFDPASPDRHRCSACGNVASGDHHHGHWARAQHLWLAERAAHLATVAVLTDARPAADRARAILAEYFTLYFELPNRDNVLGPSHLFFSTYLESIWVLNYVAAAHLLRERGWLTDEEIEAVNAILDEAATLIGEFDEGLSNRQTWNSAALTAIAAWFGDEELAQTTITGRHGLLGHLTDGFGDDGMWLEGENYHLFAIRGLLLGLHWARYLGGDLLSDPRLAESLGRALMAPASTALPDFTFPARKDSRYGVSLAHPAYLESWEVGLALLGEDAPPMLPAWLEALYRQKAASAQTYDAYLHDAGEVARSKTERTDLSWWALLAMQPALVSDGDGSVPLELSSELLPTQGVAVLRQHDRYVALDCGSTGDGHGHPDRLHLTVHAGVPWLADPGTGSYVTRDLFWYRSTLAHNAPRVDGAAQPDGDARWVAFDDQGDWGWAVAEFARLRRTVIHGPDWLLDVFESGDAGSVELPWHLDGTVTVETPGSWAPSELASEWVTDPAQFQPAAGGDVVLRAESEGRTVRLLLVGGTVIRAEGPGRPGGSRRNFYVVRATSPTRLVGVLDFVGTVETVIVGPDRIEVVTPSGATTVRLAAGSATVKTTTGGASLGGQIPAPAPHKPLLSERPIRVEGQAARVDEPPPLDGSLDGFDTSYPLELADETHYYRSEEPYDGPETFSATAFVNWDSEHFFLAVDVTKPEVISRPRDAPPLRLDNEPDDIHSDGIQVYYQVTDGGPRRGWLIRPSGDGSLVARSIPGSPAELTAVTGASVATAGGYAITVALPCPELAHPPEGGRVSFDLCINEMKTGRVRRAGQLAWGGARGWIYLRGDRRDPATWGSLELVG
jgi:hypothetical protein